MDRRWLIGAAWAVGGLLVALMLTFGAFALAGSELSEPASVPIISISASPSPSAETGQDVSPSPSAEPTGVPTAGPDDHGGSGDGSSSSGSEDHSGSDPEGRSGTGDGSGSSEDHGDD